MQGKDRFSRVSLEITKATGKQELRLQLGGGAGGDAEEADVFGGCPSTKPNRTRTRAWLAAKQDYSRGLNGPAQQLRRGSRLASRLRQRHRILRVAHVRLQPNDLFRQPAANRIDDAARPPAGMTLIVPTLSAWAQPAESPECPSQGRHGCDRCDK
jgi:hypothetical protein